MTELDVSVDCMCGRGGGIGRVEVGGGGYRGWVLGHRERVLGHRGRGGGGAGLINQNDLID